MKAPASHPFWPVKQAGERTHERRHKQVAKPKAFLVHESHQQTLRTRYLEGQDAKGTEQGNGSRSSRSTRDFTWKCLSGRNARLHCCACQRLAPHSLNLARSVTQADPARSANSDLFPLHVRHMQHYRRVVGASFCLTSCSAPHTSSRRS